MDPGYTYPSYVESTRRNRRLMALALERERLEKEDPHFRKLMEEKWRGQEHPGPHNNGQLSAETLAFVDDEEDEDEMRLLEENLAHPRKLSASPPAEEREVGRYNQGQRMVKSVALASAAAQAGSYSQKDKHDFASDAERYEFMWNYAFKDDFFDTKEQQQAKADAHYTGNSTTNYRSLLEVYNFHTD
jgi:hypothetical protein